MVEVENLSKSFGNLRAVDSVSLTVSKGEVLGFLGPNGAGKTTTMRMIAGFLTPSSGTARICGHDVVDNPTAVKRCLGYMPEGSPSYDDMTVAAFLGFIAAVRGLSGADADKRVHAVAEHLALTDVLDRAIDVLSKGYKRRVGLAQALIHDPPVLILDEPTDGLDPNQKHQVRSLIAEMAADKAIIISTHILEEVQAVCGRAVVIGQGRVLADGTAMDLLRRLPDFTAVSIVLPTAAAANAATVMRQLPGVAAVFETPLDSDRTKLRMTPRQGMTLLEDVNRAVRFNAIPATEVYRDGGTLDDAFRMITTGDAAQTEPSRAA
ncbi:MAG: ABC transporter ATP-binding protein [Rhodospirillaceae bacterium]|nr:MAG: ABC transporter ATP-binding protein [Rhodospirillaceae bacterium]